MLPEDEIRQSVTKKYARAAESDPADSACCTPVCCSGSETISRQEFLTLSAQMGYSPEELAAVPEGANLSLGCGNPQGIASLQPGETVLDLGSGAGLDCFLAARQVGSAGKVIGVDMTPEMVQRSRDNARSGGFDNVEFRLGEIEHLPAADRSVDVILSNCVINLSPDKPLVFREAYRVLKDSGRLAISDTVAVQNLPEDIKNDLDLYSSCISGAASIDDLQDILAESGFDEIQIEVKKKSSELIQAWSPGNNLAEYIRSALITAVKHQQP
jgi:SAM-dependent methyltransferase